MRIASAFAVLGLWASMAAVGVNAQMVSVPHPPMGWNSWDAYGLTITESQFRDNVAVLRDKLLPFGYNYAVVDEGWYFFNPQDRPHPAALQYALDEYGRYVPVPQRFPSAVTVASGTVEPQRAPGQQLSAAIETTSFAPLAAWVHAQGLKFGIHIVRGIPRAAVERNLPIADSSFHAPDAADKTDACPWDPTNWGVKDNAAGQAWYDALIRQYASWGVDLLKVDCISDHPYKADEIRMIRRAIDKAGRPMVLSLSPGPTSPSHAAEVSQLATMWRISNDVWDVWQAAPGADFPQSIKGQFDRAAQWMPLDVPQDRYTDLDMLPFGELRPSPGWGEPRRSRLTPDEERTVLTLWAMMRSPLIVGANLTLFDDATLKLLTNRELLRIDQDGQRAGQIEPPLDQVDEHLPKAVPGLRVLASAFPDDKSGQPGLAYAALFNTSDRELHVHRRVQDLNLVRGAHPEKAVELYDVWARKSLGRHSHVNIRIPPHGCVLLEAR